MLLKELKMAAIDELHINFNQSNITLLNFLLGFIMFGVALNIKTDDFKTLLHNPKSLFVGLSSQFIVLPLVTFLLVCIIRPQPSIALGMMMVAACPGGNISNFISSIAKANVVLSVSITGISTLLAIVMTPFNFALYASLYPPTHQIFRAVSVSPFEMFQSVLLLLGIPMMIGLWFSNHFSRLTQNIRKPIRIVSMLIFIGFIVIAFSANFDIFIHYLGFIVIIVFIQDFTALFSGYIYSMLYKVPQADSRAISIEAGIRNSGLGLVLIFNFFNLKHLGGMTLVVAWWGIWHIIGGLALASFWSRRPVKPVPYAKSIKN